MYVKNHAIIQVSIRISSHQYYDHSNQETEFDRYVYLNVYQFRKYTSDICCYRYISEIFQIFFT